MSDNITESWLCIDCGANTAPGIPDGPTTRRELLMSGESSAHIDEDSEVYIVHDKVWARAGMAGWGGCLCVGCIEKRLGWRLRPKDFDPDNIFNRMPGTPRLLERQGRKLWEPAA